MLHSKHHNSSAVDAADFAVPAAAGGVTTALVDANRAPGPAAQFLNALFAGKPAELLILIWLLCSKSSRWFRDLPAAVAYAERHADKDVYVGAALSPADFGVNHRCKAEDTAGIVALWADIDYLSDAHKKKNLPPTLQDAMDLIPAELPPSIIIHSGHGVQAWWVFRTPWVFDGDSDRADAAALADRMNALLKRRAAAHGWDVDSVSDLARVMRVPGSTNTKVQGDRRPVEIVQVTDRRYEPSEIREFLGRAAIFVEHQAAIPPAPSTAFSAPVAESAVKLDPNADPPFAKFELLSEIEPKFRASWNHERSDLRDQSPSAYDQSLATFSAMARWSDQEITNLLVAHRRKHGIDLKLRLDYFGRTIARARTSAEKHRADERAEQLLKSLMEETSTEARGAEDVNGGGTEDVAPEGEAPPSDKNGRREEIIQALSWKFQVPIKRIVKFTGDDPQYRLETELGNVALGNVNGLIYQPRLRSSVAAATGRYLPHISERAWPAIAGLLLGACEEVDRGQDATLIGTMTEWLRAYLSHQQPHESLEEADEGREPFTHEGAVYIFSSGFRWWLTTKLNEKVTQNQLTADLRAFGATPKPFELTQKDKRTTRSAWKVPAGIWEPDPEPHKSQDLL